MADAVGGDFVGAVWNSVVGMGWIAALVIVPRQQEKSLERIVYAEQFARDLLDKSNTASPEP